jgi:hypothetical protein
MNREWAEKLAALGPDEEGEEAAQEAEQTH